jgi:hypothetical protein
MAALEELACSLGPNHEGLSNFCLHARFATEPAAEGSVFSPERIGVWPPLALRRWLDETAAIYAGIAEKMAPPEAARRPRRSCQR